MQIELHGKNFLHIRTLQQDIAKKETHNEVKKQHNVNVSAETARLI